MLAERSQLDQSCGYSQDCAPPSGSPPLLSSCLQPREPQSGTYEDQFSLGVGGRRRLDFEGLLDSGQVCLLSVLLSWFVSTMPGPQQALPSVKPMIIEDMGIMVATEAVAGGGSWSSLTVGMAGECGRQYLDLEDFLSFPFFF